MMNYIEVFEVLPQPCLILEAVEKEYKIWNINRAFTVISKLKKEDHLGQSLKEIFSNLQISESCYRIFHESLENCLTKREPVILEPVKFDLQKLEKAVDDGVFWNVKFIPVDCGASKKSILTVFTDITSNVLKEREHLNTREKLDRNIEKCRYFIDENSDGLFSLDRNGNFLSLNEGLLNLAEISEEELLKLSFIPFCEDYEKEKVWLHFQKALDGSKQEFRADFVSDKGRKVVLCVSLVPLKIQGEIEGVYGIARDITEKLEAENRLKKSEEELLKSERKFKALVQEGSDMIAILNQDGFYDFVSDSVMNILGYEPQYFIKKSAFDFMHPEDKERVYNEFLQLLDSRQINVKPFRFKNASGDWRWIESKATNLLLDPDVQGIVVNSKDVTEAYLQKNEIEVLNHRYNFVSQATEDLIYDWDLKTNEIIRNSVFQENYGFTKDDKSEIPVNIWFDRVHEEDRVKILESFKSALEKPCQNKWIQEYRFHMKNGKLAYLVDRAFILRNEAGVAIRVVGAVMDVTDSREALLKIEKQNMFLKEIAWEHAHITRAPLARIKALIDTLEDNTFEEWNKRELIGMIRTSADELDEYLLKKIQKIENVNA